WFPGECRRLRGGCRRHNQPEDRDRANRLGRSVRTPQPAIGAADARPRAATGAGALMSSAMHLDGEIRDGKHYQAVRVYYEDTDFSGIVYHASYLRFMERGRTNYLRLIGADHRALFEQAEKEAPGFAFVVRH